VGNLYATTYSGGDFNYGVVFKITTSGLESVLHHFAGGTDGASPEGRLLRTNAGVFFGTTTAGGVSGAGTVFAITGTGKEVVLYSFAGGTDGAGPEAGLALDAEGNLYGTTTAGGANGNGTVFKLTAPKKGAKWTETVLYSFGTGGDGAVPVAGVTLDKAGISTVPLLREALTDTARVPVNPVGIRLDRKHSSKLPGRRRWGYSICWPDRR
jgi:uncharacterized repeat protein (TIGR03803 family)